MDAYLEKKVSTKSGVKIPPISAGEFMRMERNTTVEHLGFRSSFMEKLKVREQELIEALKGLNGSEDAFRGTLSADDVIELLDRAEREMSTQMRYKLLERKKMELGRIQHLLTRMLKDEAFGICEDCDRRIPEARLLIVPEATRCVRCQSETEKQDSKRSLLEKSRDADMQKRRLESEDGEESDFQGISFKIDMEPESFADIEVTELED